MRKIRNALLAVTLLLAGSPTVFAQCLQANADSLSPDCSEELAGFSE